MIIIQSLEFTLEFTGVVHSMSLNKFTMTYGHHYGIIHNSFSTLYFCFFFLSNIMLMVTFIFLKIMHVYSYEINEMQDLTQLFSYRACFHT